MARRGQGVLSNGHLSFHGWTLFGRLILRMGGWVLFAVAAGARFRCGISACGRPTRRHRLIADPAHLRDLPTAQVVELPHYEVVTGPSAMCSGCHSVPPRPDALLGVCL